MSREIKFRFWDGSRKEMNYYNLLDLMEIEFYAPEFMGEAMQYTGLKDINGKEIYEGDIVKFEGLHGRTVVLSVPIGRPFTSYSGYYSEEYSCISTDWNATCVIIGNIYETPELVDKES